MSWIYKPKSESHKDIFTLCFDIKKTSEMSILKSAYVEHDNKVFDMLPSVMPMYEDYLTASKIMLELNNNTVFTEEQFDWLVSFDSRASNWFEIYSTI